MKLETRRMNFDLNQGQKMARGGWKISQKTQPEGGGLDFVGSVVDSSIQSSNLGLGIVVK